MEGSPTIQCLGSGVGFRYGQDFVKISLLEAKKVFNDPFSERTILIVDVHFITEAGPFPAGFSTTEVRSKRFESGGNAHAEVKALEYLEALFREECPTKKIENGFVTIKLFMSRSPCPDCVNRILSFYHANMYLFHCGRRTLQQAFGRLGVTVGDRADEYPGLLEILFSHGWHQNDSVKFIDPMILLMKANVAGSAMLNLRILDAPTFWCLLNTGRNFEDTRAARRIC